jgi:hypothetical protein
MNDDYLTRFRKPPRPEFAAELYGRISKPMYTQSKIPSLRFAALSISLLIVSILAAGIPGAEFCPELINEWADTVSL